MKNPDVFPAEILKLPDLSEELDKRNLNSKTYSLGENKHRCRIGIGAGHYFDNTWKEIDLTIREEDDFYVIDKAPYILKIFKNEIGYSYTGRNGGRVDVKLNSIDDTPVTDIGLDIHPEFIPDMENRLVWRNPVENLDFFILACSLKASMYKSLKNENAPTKFTWDVYEDLETQAHFKQKTVGHDKDKQRMDLENNIEDQETTEKYKHFKFTEEFKNQVAKIKDKKTRIKEWTTDIHYPAVIDADVTENIVANVDDGQERVGMTTWFSITGANYYWNAGRFNIYSTNGGVRFRTIPIPQGSIIDLANLKLTVAQVVGGPQLKIYGDKVPDAALWANGDLPSGITQTTNYTNWSATATGLNTVDVKSIVQEIVNLAWVSNNDMRFGIINQITGMTLRYVKVVDYNGPPGEAVLEIDWSPAPPAPANPLIGKPLISPDMVRKAKIR